MRYLCCVPWSDNPPSGKVLWSIESLNISWRLIRFYFWRVAGQETGYVRVNDVALTILVLSALFFPTDPITPHETCFFVRQFHCPWVPEGFQAWWEEWEWPWVTRPYASCSSATLLRARPTLFCWSFSTLPWSRWVPVIQLLFLFHLCVACPKVECLSRVEIFPFSLPWLAISSYILTIVFARQIVNSTWHSLEMATSFDSVI